MSHRIEEIDGAPREASYSWRLRGQENRVGVTVDGEFREVAEGSDEEFITEHYWGYARRSPNRTTEYRVEHPRWRFAAAASSEVDCNISALYGDRFVEPMQGKPASAFLAEGSEVSVFQGITLCS